MCGFAALFDRGRCFNSEVLNEMQMDLHHRGPDSGGTVSDIGSALVFRRLSIMDPGSQSDQPMSDSTGRYTIVYNGEIYNFKKLRAELVKKGKVFRTNGDTEVLLEAYIVWGIDIIPRLEGMFAFLVLDRVEQTVIAARDPLGIKPLYMAQRGSLTMFSSEVRPLARLISLEEDPVALSELLVFRFAGGRLSNFKDVQKVPGGTVIKLSLMDNTLVERRFEDPLDTLIAEKEMTLEEATEMARTAIKESIVGHLQSDVGYTLQLSGGVDSSLIAAITSNLNERVVSSYGVKLEDEGYDESEYRGMVVDRCGLRHTEVQLSGDDFAEALPVAVKHMEGPVPHAGCVMLMLLCQKIKETSKVVLTGEGADELFGGYKRYGLWKDLRKKGRLANLVPGFLWPFLSRYREVQKYAGRDPAIYASVHHDLLALQHVFPDLMPFPGKREEVASQFSDFRYRMLAVDQSSYLESLLMRQDKMAMAASVEARVPFTHFPLAKVINQIPHRYLVPGGETKPLLKAIAGEFLPAEVIYRRKVGLNLPLDRWAADTGGLGRYLDYLMSSDSRLAVYADRKKFTSCLDNFYKGRKHGSLPIPHMINLELWLRSVPGGKFLSRC